MSRGSIGAWLRPSRVPSAALTAGGPSVDDGVTATAPNLAGSREQSGPHGRRISTAAVPLRVARSSGPVDVMTPIPEARDIYRTNPKLIPGFWAEGKRQLDDPEERRREADAFKRCGREYAERHSLPLGGTVQVDLVYEIVVSDGVGDLKSMYGTDGGDEHLVMCLWDARPWLSRPFPLPGAFDGTFRWRVSQSVPLGVDFARPLRPRPSAQANGKPGPLSPGHLQLR
jgi:hypothetical protein